MDELKRMSTVSIIDGNSRSSAEQGLIFEILAELLDSHFSNSEIKDWLLQRLQQWLGSHSRVILLWNENGNGTLLSIDPNTRMSEEDIQFVNAANELMKKCYATRTAVRFPDNQEATHLDFDAIQRASMARSLACVPIVNQNGCLGLIALFSEQTGVFTDERLGGLELLAKATGNALHHNLAISSLTIDNASLEVKNWQLLHSRNTLRFLFDSLPTSIYIVDEAYRLIAINRHRSNRIQAEPKELVGRQCYEALYNRVEICTDCMLYKTLQERLNTNRSKRDWQSDGDAQEWEIRTYPIYDDTENSTQGIIIEQDVTEKNRLEALIAQSEKLAAVGQLAAGIAHEINNPLTAIIAFTQLLQREIPAEDDKQELVGMITQAGERAASVVRSLLDLVRKETFVTEPVDINASIKTSLAFVQHELVAHEVDLDLDLGQDLPQVIASQNHLHGVWVNLLTNAIDACEASKGRVTVQTRRVDQEVQVSISDTGKGIPSEQLDHIFEPFFTTKAPGSGTGLGLSVCHRIVSQHGGRILVDSQVNDGTKFTVILPIN